MRAKMKITFITSMIAVMLFISACSGKSPESSSGDTATPQPSSSSNQQQETETAAPGPFGKYDSTVKLSTVRYLAPDYKFAPGESLDNNIWIPIFRDELGIELENLWIVDKSQYEGRLNLAITSGDLPDFMEVDRTTLQRLVEADLVEDLTDYYDNFASPFLKDLMNEDGGTALASASVGGRLMAIPKTESNGGVSSSDMIWVRTDWLEKAGLPLPQTMDDVIKTAEAFSKLAPNTIGLGINKDLYNGIGTIVGFFNGFHAYPNIWVEDGSGQLVYGSTLPEMKDALQALQDLYRAGLIDMEFPVKSRTNIAEDMLSGRLGLVYGRVDSATIDFREMYASQPGSQWQAIPIVSNDSQPAKTISGEPAEAYYIVKKGIKHPEAVLKLLNLYLEKFLNTPYAKGSDNPFIIDTSTGIFPARYAPITLTEVTHNLKAYHGVTKALDTGDGSQLVYPASLHYERNVNYLAGDESMWFSNRTFGPEGAFGVIDHYFQTGNYVSNGFVGAATPSMVERQATLMKMQDETITRIIMGDLNVSDYDNFVEEWKRVGGNEITEEVNEWYKNSR